jgi:cytoskeletal protein CcmA (bactofilin family)
MTRRVSYGSIVFWLGVLPTFATSPIGAESSQEVGRAGIVMMDEDYFSAGGSAELDKRIEGDAFLSGGRVAVRGPVKGDVAVAGGDISAADTVGQDLYAAGGSVAISGQVAGNARIAGAQVTVSPRGGIAGKATVAAANLRMAGRVGRYLAVYAESVRIEGEIGGDLRVVARWLEIGPDAKIGGKLIYRSPQLAKIDPTALIAGGVTHVPIEWPSGELGSLTRLATWVSIVLLVCSLLLMGVVMMIAFPKFSSAAARTVRSDPWKALALGFCLLLCLPVAAILFMATIIGIPVGIAVLLLYPVMLLLGFVTGALSLGDRVAVWIAKRRGGVVKPGWRYAALSASLLALLLVCKVPLLGCGAAFLVLLFGLGAFWICAYRGYLRQGPAQETPPLGLDLV